MLFESDSCVRIYKQGPILATPPNSKNVFFYQRMRPKSGLKSPRPLALIGQAVSEKKNFENGGRRTDDGRTEGRLTDGRRIMAIL